MLVNIIENIREYYHNMHDKYTAIGTKVDKELNILFKV